jgi:hypothetical protein
VEGHGSIPGQTNTQGLKITEKVLPLLCKWLDSRHGSDDHINCSPVSARDVKHKGHKFISSTCMYCQVLPSLNKVPLLFTFYNCIYFVLAYLLPWITPYIKIKQNKSQNHKTVNVKCKFDKFRVSPIKSSLPVYICQTLFLHGS